MTTVDSLVWVSRKEFPEERWAVIEDELLVVPIPRRTVAVETVDGVDKKVWRTEESGEPINTLVERDGLFGIPINYAIETLGLDPDDKTELGSVRFKAVRLPDPMHPSAPPSQKQFMDEVFDSIIAHETTLACAPTGSGKTVVVLNAAGRLGVATLIIVPNGILVDQWRNEVVRHLGIHASEIGTVGGGKESWKGKKVVIAIIHNLFMRKFPEEFYRNFGFVAWDEAHRLGAPEFGKTMTMFPSRYKIAVTATPGRKDGLDMLMWNYFGRPRVVATAPALETTCWRIKFPLIGNLSWMDRCRNDVRPVKWLATLPTRNAMLVKLIVQLHGRGYHIIAMSRFIDHCEQIKSQLIALGIPETDIGQFTRTQGAKNTRVGQGYLDEMKKRRIIIGTYAMLKEGYDDPRRDAGIELLPVADNKQGIGRVRRPHADKKKPLWFSIEDLNVPLFVRYSKSRMSGFQETNVKLKILDINSI